jgi:signal-induced proliferation-associated 1 like protein 2
MYNMHCNTEFGSEAFDEFLEILGSKVKMRGFPKYRAQLDNKSKESMYCTYTYYCACTHH